MTNSDISQVCSMILSNLGFPNETLISLIQKWLSFVDECEDGFQWDFSEYKNEIRVRYLIQCLIDDERLSKAAELKEAFDEIEKLDNRFKSLLKTDDSLDEARTWWERGILAKAGQDYCQYIYDAHGIVVKNIDC